MRFRYFDFRMKGLFEPGYEKMCLMPYANNKGADQPAHPRSLISAYIVHCLDSIISLDSIAEISRLQLASVAAQAGLCLAWWEAPEDTFSHDIAHLYLFSECHAKLMLVCLFCSNVAFQQCFSHISTAGSSMLTFIVLPHCRIISPFCSRLCKTLRRRHYR